MKSRYPLGEIELRGNKLFLIHRIKNGKVELDITPVWHFFKEVEEFLKKPIPPDEEK